MRGLRALIDGAADSGASAGPDSEAPARESGAAHTGTPGSPSAVLDIALTATLWGCALRASIRFLRPSINWFILETRLGSRPLSGA